MDFPETRFSLLHRLENSSDPVAWAEFCQLYERTIYQIARRSGLQDADAREIIQEVLLKVSRRLSQFDRDRDGRFRSWLATIARNSTIDLIRRDAVLHRRGAADSRLERLLANRQQTETDIEVYRLEEHREQFRWAAEQVRRQVSSDQWRSFWLTAVEGLSGAAAASEIGSTIGAVYAARCRVLAKIKQLVEPYREEQE